MSETNGRSHSNGFVRGSTVEEFDKFTPPQNLEAERSVLGSILLEDSMLPGVADILCVADFYRDAHQVVFQAMLDLYELGKAIDPVTLADELMRQNSFKKIGGDDLLREIIEAVPHAANAMYYAQIVKELADKRRLLEGAQDIAALIHAREHTSSQLMEIATRKIIGLGIEVDEGEHGLQALPPRIEAEAFAGLAGDIIALIEPHTEADPGALLGQFLVAFGNMMGRRAHWLHDATRHHANLFLTVVGSSSKSRKGTSWDIIRWLLARVDEEWNKERILSGLTTGEGLISQVRDPIIKGDVVIDPGVDDKRVLFMEAEFGGMLSLMGREGSSLSAVVRTAFDGGYLRNPTKNSPQRATNAHVSIIGHITAPELRARLSEVDAWNGFANRFLWLFARRSKLLPDGGRFHQIDFTNVFCRLADVYEFVKRHLNPEVPFHRDAGASELWHQVYGELSEARPGIFGAVVSRAECLVMRLAMIYAVLDLSVFIRRSHLASALAFWRNCQTTASFLFGDRPLDRASAKVLDLIRDHPEGLTPTQINRELFSGHKFKETGEILAGLLSAGLVAFEEVVQPRHKKTIWKPI
jgi:hypothetical protein